MILLPPGSAKNRMPRRVTMNPAGKVHKLLAALVEGKQQHAYVFSRDKQGSIPVRDFRAEWEKIVDKMMKHEPPPRGSGKNGRLLFHDLRRSAITRMAESGLSEAESMSVAGHLTPAVHRRYKQLSEDVAREIASKIDPDT
jgi:integrase